MRRARVIKERSELIIIFSIKACGQGFDTFYRTRTSITKNYPVVKTFDLIVAWKNLV